MKAPPFPGKLVALEEAKAVAAAYPAPEEPEEVSQAIAWPWGGTTVPSALRA